MKVKYDSMLLTYLVKELSGKSRNNIKSLLKYRQVIVNGKVVTKHDYLLNVGDVIEISKFRSDDELDILYEDDYFLAINKPNNILSVQNAKGEYTAISMMLKYLKKSNVNPKVFVLHRLDKATSGVFLIAKSEEIKNIMQADWNNIVTSRDYFTVVEGKVSKDGRIVSNLVESDNHLVYSAKEGKQAITNYHVIKYNNDYSILDVNIETGRKNQIRVHMKEMGHPVLSDNKYGNRSKFIKRLGLHAYRLQFTHPVSKKVVTIETSMPSEFRKLMKYRSK